MKTRQRRIGALCIAFALTGLAAAVHIVAQSEGPVEPELLKGICLPAADGLQPRWARNCRGRGACQPAGLYMGSAGGVFKTTDAGLSLDPGHRRADSRRSIGVLAVADSNPDVVYVGTGTACRARREPRQFDNQSRRTPCELIQNCRPGETNYLIDFRKVCVRMVSFFSKPMNERMVDSLCHHPHLNI